MANMPGKRKRVKVRGGPEQNEYWIEVQGDTGVPAEPGEHPLPQRKGALDTRVHRKQSPDHPEDSKTD